MTDCQLEEVHFQTKHLGWKTDDMLLIAKNGAGQVRKLAGQSKISFTISSKDKDCREAFSGFWSDFHAHDRFDPERDRLAVITLRGTDTLLRHFNSLIDCAQAALSAADFQRRLGTDRFLHSVSRRQASEIRKIVEETAARVITDEEFLQFVRAIRVLSYDLNTTTAATESQLKSLLAFTANSHDKSSAAHETWLNLVDLAGISMPAAGSFSYEKLPEILRRRHATVGPTEHAALKELRDHSAPILSGIRSDIDGTISLPRAELVAQVLEALESSRVVLVAGQAGFGKSAIAKASYQVLERDHFAFSFRADEFARAHLDETLQAAQIKINGSGLAGLLAPQSRKVLLIESVERLLERQVRDSFMDLLQLVKDDASWRIILTCRDYQLEVVESSLLAHAALPYAIVTIPELTETELDEVVTALPILSQPTKSSFLKKLLRNPFLLDKAARMKWPQDQPLPEGERAFRARFWKDVVREDGHAVGALPDRRETTMTEVALRRASSLALFAHCDGLDPDALAALRARGLVISPENNNRLAAPAHDMLEDWTIVRWLEQRFAANERAAPGLASDIGTLPALRRSYRKWLGEMLECDVTVADQFVASVIQDDKIPQQFRDDTIVSALRSTSAARFLERNRAMLARDNYSMLRRVIHLLRVACRTTPPWIRSPEHVASLVFVPKGSAWVAVLRVVREECEKLLPDDAALLVGLIEDWASSVAWWASYPEGAKDAAKIAFTVLPHLKEYRDELKKPTLRVILKIPKADSEGFLGLLARASAQKRDDRVGWDFADLLLQGIDGTFTCRDFPDGMIHLAQRAFLLTEDDRNEAAADDHGVDMGPFFGIKSMLDSDFFPASAHRGPFLPLLRFHPEKGIDFIVRLANHAATWYGDRKSSGYVQLEPAMHARLRVPNAGEISQWANSRLWCLYRGTSVGPNVLQSALMSLEAWLLELGKTEAPYLDTLLLKLLRDSNNVMISAVVASACNAFPKKTPTAGIALMTCKEFFYMDRGRMVSESHSPGRLYECLPGVRVEDEFYQAERSVADQLPHRRVDLEHLTLKLQLGEHRSSVWAVLDVHKNALPKLDEQTDDDRLWRLVLHRMDIRTFQPMPAPKGVEQTATITQSGEVRTSVAPQEDRIYVGPGPIDQDIKTMLDRDEPQRSQQLAEIGLLNWGIGAWRGDGSSDAWKTMLQDAQQQVAKEPALQEPRIGGSGFVAAVCVRDYWRELTIEERRWCTETLIREVERACDNNDHFNRVARSPLDPSRPAAYLLPKISCELGIDAFDGRLLMAMARALTHATTEVVNYAAAGVGQFLGCTNRVFMKRCLGSLALKARLVSELATAEAKKPHGEQRSVWECDRIVVPQIREAIISGTPPNEEECALPDLSTWPGEEGGRTILTMLDRVPDDPIARTAFRELANQIATWWNEERSPRGRRRERSYEFEYESEKRLACFVLRLPESEASEVCDLLFTCVKNRPSEVARFFVDVLFAESSIVGKTPFWALWQGLADRVRELGWVGRSDYWGTSEVLRAIFLVGVWKEGIRHWPKLDGFADRIDRLCEGLPANSRVVEVYSRYLYGIGGQSLPSAFIVVAGKLRAGDVRELLAERNTVFCLESLLTRFVYSEPLRLKRDPDLRVAVLTILDGLVEAGSSAAYRMRDDFVTPTVPESR
ncbi:MAG: ATP-binding protein [Planctomycetes bacterium]|nr:ATP-binding protein [Planctomycetota bacterium]